MKICGTDFGVKYVGVKVDGKEIVVSFKDTFWKGIHDVNVFYDNKEITSPEIKMTYPCFTDRVKEAWMLIKGRLRRLKRNHCAA